MTDIVAIARTRIEELRAQIAELERFLEMFERISAEEAAKLPKDTKTDATLWEFSAGNVTPQKPVDNFPKRVRRIRNKMRPGDVADLMARIIREVGRPMTRGEIVEAFEKRDVQIPFEDKARYIGTIAWRHKGLFKNVDGFGYWLAGEPLPSFSRNKDNYIE